MISWQPLISNISPKDLVEYGDIRITKSEPYNIGGIVINNSSGKAYNVSIQMDTEKLEPNTKVRCYCGCDNFQFQWAYVLHTHDALIAPKNFILTPPKIKNPGAVAGVCKHLKVFLDTIKRKV